MITSVIFDLIFQILISRGTDAVKERPARPERDFQIGNLKSKIANLFCSFPRRFARVQRSSSVTLAQLTARAALQLCLFVRAVAGAAIDRQNALDFGVGAPNHVYADQFTNAPGGRSPGISRRFDRAHVSTPKDGDVTRPDILLTEQLHVRRFDHRVSGFDGADKTFRLDHSECFQGHLRQSSLFKILEIKKQIDYASSYHRVT